MAIISPRSVKIIGTSGETSLMPQYSLVYCGPNGEYYLADNSNSLTADCVGIISQPGGIQSGSLGTVQINPCLITNSSWELTKGATVYLGSSGELTQTLPTAGIVKPVGFAVTETQILFNPEIGWEAGRDEDNGSSIDIGEAFLEYIDTDVTLADSSNVKVPSQRAVKTYIDNKTSVGEGSTPPSTGTWVIGNIYMNSVPSSSGYVGWVCTVSGTPGTWKGFGLIA